MKRNLVLRHVILECIHILTPGPFFNVIRARKSALVVKSTKTIQTNTISWEVSMTSVVSANWSERFSQFDKSLSVWIRLYQCFNFLLVFKARKQAVSRDIQQFFNHVLIGKCFLALSHNMAKSEGRFCCQLSFVVVGRAVKSSCCFWSPLFRSFIFVTSLLLMLMPCSVDKCLCI